MLPSAPTVLSLSVSLGKSPKGLSSTKNTSHLPLTAGGQGAKRHVPETEVVNRMPGIRADECAEMVVVMDEN